MSGACTVILVSVASNLRNSTVDNVHFPTTLSLIVTFVNGAVVKLNLYVYDLPSSTAPSFGTFNDRCNGCTIMDTFSDVTLYFLSSLIQTIRAVVDVAPVAARNAICLLIRFHMSTLVMLLSYRIINEDGDTAIKLESTSTFTSTSATGFEVTPLNVSDVALAAASCTVSTFVFKRIPATSSSVIVNTVCRGNCVAFFTNTASSLVMVCCILNSISS